MIKSTRCSKCGHIMTPVGNAFNGKELYFLCTKCDRLESLKALKESK